MAATVSESSTTIQTSEEAPKHTEPAAKTLSTPTTVTPCIFESPGAIQTSEEPKQSTCSTSMGKDSTATIVAKTVSAPTTLIPNSSSEAPHAAIQTSEQPNTSVAKTVSTTLIPNSSEAPQAAIQPGNSSSPSLAGQITNPKELVTNPKHQTRSQASKVVAEKAQAIVEQRVPAPGVVPIQPKKKGGKCAKKIETHKADQECQRLARLYESGGQVVLAEAETYKPGEPLVRLPPGTELSKALHG